MAKERQKAQKQISKELRIGFLAIIVGLIGIAISLLTSSYTLVQPADPLAKLIIAAILTILGLVIFIIVVKLVWANWEYIKG